MQRRLGGASNLWGGRCVPMNALDFEARTILNQSGWPVQPWIWRHFCLQPASTLAAVLRYLRNRSPPSTTLLANFMF